MLISDSYSDKICVEWPNPEPVLSAPNILFYLKICHRMEAAEAPKMFSEYVFRENMVGILNLKMDSDQPEF